VLPGYKTEPGRELSGRAELRAIADRRHQRRRGDDTDAGDGRKTASAAVRFSLKISRWLRWRSWLK
jgi:hypothetical protein